VERVDREPGLTRLAVRLPPGKGEGVAVGASVAINGTCLTVTGSEGDLLFFDVMSETLRATNLGKLDAASRVNFERSARVGDEIGGHGVSGHVHTTAAVRAREESPNNVRMVFELPDDAWTKYLLPKARWGWGRGRSLWVCVCWVSGGRGRRSSPPGCRAHAWRVCARARYNACTHAALRHQPLAPFHGPRNARLPAPLRRSLPSPDQIAPTHTPHPRATSPSTAAA
jgi:hypothetical protein